MKKKYYLLGLLILAVLMFAYHFIAAYQAETQIDNLIKEYDARNDSLSIQYSSLEIAPFAATISIHDLNFILGDHIERAHHLQVDMRYLDFLRIYIGGLPYGLKNLDKAKLTLLSPSYVNRSSLEEIKSDTVVVNYTGNAWDGLQYAVRQKTVAYEHHFIAKCSGMTISLPDNPISKLSAEKFTYSGKIEAGQRSFWLKGTHHFELNSLLWTPTEAFQKKYSFFIKGFGYKPNAIPFKTAQLHVSSTSEQNQLTIKSNLKSDLAMLSASGQINLESPIEDSRFINTKISLIEPNETLKNVLGNIERLFSLTLPKTHNGNTITLKITGTLASPRPVN
jgi:hypothetical protein